MPLVGPPQATESLSILIKTRSSIRNGESIQIPICRGKWESSVARIVLGLLQIRASHQQPTIVFESTLRDQFHCYFLDPFAVFSEGWQRIILEGAEMIDKRIDGDAAVDTFSSHGAEPDDFAAMRLIPFVGKNFDIHIGSVRQVAPEAQG